MSLPKPKMLIINFPANPTAQCVELPFFEKIVALAKEYGIYVVHDLAYADICFDGWKAPSIMQVPGARDVAVEFFTMSKSYNMAGWRIGFMVGNRDLVTALGADQGLPRLRHVHADPGGGDRRARGSAGLRGRDLREVPERAATCWSRACTRPAGWSTSRRRRCTCGRRFPKPTASCGSLEFTKKLLAKAKVSVSPGIGFGEYGDDHVRFAMIENETRTRQAVRGIKQMFREDGLLRDGRAR